MKAMTPSATRSFSQGRVLLAPRLFPAPLVPATLAFTAEGTPYSAAFDDVYHSSQGGPAQARHVFLGGNGLPERWRARRRFTILETGFGMGLNFLATWSAWREDPGRPAKLHFVSIEKHPFSAADLVRLHARTPEFSERAAELAAAWPMLVPGMHRLELDGGRVVLTLFFGDIANALPQLRLAADAFYLDGFAPSKNPDMWSIRAMKSIGRLAAANATLATYTAASAVRESLGAAGFTVEKRTGFAKKRDMLCARFTVARVAPAAPLRRALVIGAGLAGSAVCERLAARGWDIVLIERRDAPAMEASGNHAGAFHPLITPDDSFMARLTRAGFVYALRHWKTLQEVDWSECGVLQMPRTDEEDDGQRAALSSLGLPPEYARYLSRSEAAEKTAADVGTGGLWFARAGWVRPATLVRGLLHKARASMRFGIEVCALERNAVGWAALDAAGHVLAEAPVVVLANAGDAVRLAPIPDMELRSVRGQVTYLPAARFPAIRAVLLRGGMAIPPVEGIALAGASFDIGDTDPAARPDSHAGNLERLARILPGAEAGFDPSCLDGRVGFRAVARDRLPLVGPHPDSPGLHCAFGYGSRGILWCSLMAELLASRLEAEPLPVEARLADALDPGRFARRGNRGTARRTARGTGRGSTRAAGSTDLRP